MENVLKTEDNLEINSEEESDLEPTEEDNDSELSCPKYTFISGMQWSRLPSVRSKRQQKNIIIQS